MELTQLFFQTLGEDYDEENVKKALWNVEMKICEENAYYELGTAEVKEELTALIDLIREFTFYIKDAGYKYLYKYLCIYS